MYTIKEAAARAGVTVPVLRAWERRYAIVEPARTASGYRLYDEEAIGRVRAMRRLVDAGWAPSTAAAHIAVRGVDEDGREAAAAPLVTAFVDAAASLDGATVGAVLDEMFARGSFERVARDQLLPALEALGDAWAAGRISVDAEHAASHAVLRRLAAAFDAAGVGPLADRVVLVGLPPGSQHELGALVFAIAARRAGLPVLYLGPNLPADDWVRVATERRARVAVIGVVTDADRDNARRVADGLASVPGVAVAFGGTAAPRVSANDGRVTTLPDDLYEAVETTRALLQPAPRAEVPAPPAP